mmetsp:Transcript_37239/g.52594  ORF Transcript_37239/g.52594 Transcript_37239/m.52594 type:complete len:384 (+) Transcript_37239:225-1376(+)
MRTSWEKLIQYFGTSYGQDISNELTNKQELILPKPDHSDDVKAHHSTREAMVRTGQRILQIARRVQIAPLTAAVDAGDAKAPMKLAILQNEIEQGVFELSQEIPIILSDSEKTQNSSNWRAYRERLTSLVKYRGQAFVLIQGQCTQMLQDQMKQDSSWSTVSISYKPIQLYRLIKKTILSQTEDQYPFTTVYDQEYRFYSFRQETLPNPQWYERFNTNIDVGAAIGVTRKHKVLLEYVAKKIHNMEFNSLGVDNKKTNHLANRKIKQIFKAFLEIYQYYLHCRFPIDTIHADNEFGPLKQKIGQTIPGGPRVNLASANEHVPAIDRRIRVVKERVWVLCHSVPFTRIPKILTIHIVFVAVKILNFFKSRGGSSIFSPWSIMLG